MRRQNYALSQNDGTADVTESTIGVTALNESASHTLKETGAKRMEDSQWMSWVEVPWLQRTAPHSTLIRFCERLARIDDLSEMVTELAAEFGVPRCSLVTRDETWETLVNRGEALRSLPGALLADVIDRDAAVWTDSASDDPLMLIPTASKNQDVLVLAGPRLDSSQLAEGLGIGRVVGQRLDQLDRLARAER